MADRYTCFEQNQWIPRSFHFHFLSWETIIFILSTEYQSLHEHFHLTIFSQLLRSDHKGFIIIQSRTLRDRSRPFRNRRVNLAAQAIIIQPRLYSSQIHALEPIRYIIPKRYTWCIIPLELSRNKATADC